MNWLSKIPRGREQLPEDTRFVAHAPTRLPGPVWPRKVGEVAPQTRAVPSLLPAQLSGPQVEQEQLSCTLITESPWLIDQLAGIALAAAVRIDHREIAAYAPDPAPHGPVLWGLDAAVQLGSNDSRRCDVLLGTETESEQLWLLASTRPHTRVAVLPHAASWLGEYLGQWALNSGHGYTLMFSALAGGIGTSTLSSLLAHAGTLSGLRTVLVDLDPFSGSLWPLMNWQETTGVGWEQLQDSGGTLAAHQFREVLTRVADTAILTWQHEPFSFRIDESLAVRVLAAARQAFDLVVIDTGRYINPLARVLGQFIDQQVITCAPEQLAKAGDLGHPYILCLPARNSAQLAPDQELLRGTFPMNNRIARCAGRAELFEALRSKGLRRRLADYDLLPARTVANP